MSEATDREPPVVASYCATFLKPEMRHIYRQITALRRVRPIVIARKRENDFPFSPVILVPRPRSEFLRRVWYRQLRDAPWPIADREKDRLLEILQRSQAALLHIYFGHIAVRLLPLIKSWPKPTIVSFHGADVGVDLEKADHRAATQEMLAAVRLVLVRSESLRRALLGLGTAPEKILLQRTGIPLSEFPFLQRTAPRDGAWQLVQASRLIEKKGIATTLRAFQEFHRSFPLARLFIAGEGEERARLEKMTSDLGLRSAVEFTGFLDQKKLRELYEQSHLFVHPSEIGRDGNQEGVPNSMLEAMANGLPVIATHHGGIPEAVENEVSGMLAAEKDFSALAQAMTGLARDPEKFGAMSRAAAEAVAQNFDRAAQAQRLEEIYLGEIARESTREKFAAVPEGKLR